MISHWNTGYEKCFSKSSCNPLVGCKINLVNWGQHIKGEQVENMSVDHICKGK